MGIIDNIRNYEVSIWTLQDSFITILKQSNLENIEKIQEPKMTLKDDGENNFSFKIPMYIRQEGILKENPVWYTTRNGNIIANMRKIKVIFNKSTDLEKVFEFIILKVTEEHDGLTKFCNVDCEGLAFHELGKQGYNIELSADNVQKEYEDWLEGKIENEPITTINYWVEKVLDNTNWTYLVCMDWSAQDGVLTDGSGNFIDNNRYINDETYRNSIDSFRAERNLRSKQKIYRDPYISSWELQNDKLIAKEEVKDLSQLEFRTCVEGSKSNRYNLLQSIAEAFKVFCKFVYEYDENYHIIGRKVIFYNNFISEANGALDFNYGYNTQNISREMESNDLISKMYVESLSDSGIFGGEIFLSDSAVNKSLENYLLNFDYLYNIGTISQDQYDEIENYFAKIRELNEEINNIELNLQDWEAELPIVQAQKDHFAASLEEDAARITEAGSYLSSMVGNTQLEYTKNNPCQFTIIQGNTYYSNIYVDGVIRNTLKIYKNKKCSSNQEIEKYYSVITDENNNIIRIKYDNNLKDSLKNLGAVWATFSYNPQIPYQAVIQTYTAKQTKDQDFFDSYKQSEVKLQKDINDNKSILEEKLKQKEALVASFERMMGPALREGTWQPERDYVNYQINKVFTTTSKLENISNFSSTAEVDFIWDENAFDEEIQNFYTFGAEEEKKYYPCLKLTSEMIGTLTSEDLTGAYLVYKDLDSTTYPSDSDPRAFHYLPLNAETGCQYAFLKNNDNNKIEPVLIITGATNLLDYKVGNKTYSVYAQVKNNARISKVTGYNDTQNTITETVLISNLEQWISEGDLDKYKVVFPRFQINNKMFLQTTPEKKISRKEVSGEDEFLTENEDYYMLYRNRKWYITLKYETILEHLDAIYSLHYSLSTAADAMYLDAIDVMKENAFPKVSYDITPSAIDKNFIKNAYDYLGQLAHINDDELKFENVQGYISEVTLNLDKPWEDSYTIKNYKTKFEDIFSSIVAQTENMKKNSTVIGMAANLITPEGIIESNTLNKSLLSSNVEDIIKSVAPSQTSIVNLQSRDAASASLVNKIINGDLGLNFGANDNIERVVLNNQEGFIIQGYKDGYHSWFQVNHEAMGFFHLDNNGNQVDDLYYANGDLTLSGVIKAKEGGEIGGWVIGQNNIYRNNSNNDMYTQLGGNDYAFFAGASNGDEAPFSIAYDGTLKANKGFIGGKNGWRISENFIGNDDNYEDATIGIYNGPNSNEVFFVEGKSNEGNSYAKYFTVFDDGSLYAGGAVLEGPTMINALNEGNSSYDISLVGHKIHIMDSYVEWTPGQSWKFPSNTLFFGKDNDEELIHFSMQFIDENEGSNVTATFNSSAFSLGCVVNDGSDISYFIEYDGQLSIYSKERFGVNTLQQSSIIVNYDMISIESQCILLGDDNNNLYQLLIKNTAPTNNLSDRIIWIDNTGTAAHSGWTECKIYYKNN